MTETNSGLRGKQLEEAALAGLLMGGLGRLSHCTLTSEHFGLPAVRVAFGAIAELETDSTPFDVVGVAECIRRRGEGEMCPPAYLSEVLAKPDYAMAHHDEVFARYVLDLEEWRRLRGVEAALRNGLAGLAESAESADGIAAVVRSDLDKIAEGGETQDSVTVTACDGVLKMVERIKAGGGKKLGFFTGVPCYDTALSGLFPGLLDVVGARPKIGKTAMVETIAQTLIEQDLACSLFEKDMSVEILIARMACRAAEVVFEDFFHGLVNGGQLHRVKQRLNWLKKKAHLLRIHNPAVLTAGQLGMQAQRDKERFGTVAFFLDHFQHLRHDGRQSRVEGLTESSMELRRVVDRTKLAGCVIAQLSKEAEKDGRPSASHFKFCDQLFSDADRVVLLWSNDDPKELEPNERQTVQFSVDANRMGAPVDQQMHFHRELMKFESYTK